MLPTMLVSGPAACRLSRLPSLLLLAALLLSLVLPLPGAAVRSSRAASKIIYVVPGGAGAQSGADWANANDLQAALTAAVSGTELWVKAGTYKATSEPDRNATFALKNGVALYGGFAGNETARSQRRLPANPTILNGDLLGNDGPGWFTDSDNSYHVVTGSGTNATAILDGFTISSGNAKEYSSATAGDGGGIFISSGHPTLRNLIVTGNQAWRGGGMYNHMSSPMLANVTFSGNTGESGAGISNTNSSPTLKHVTISGNTGSGMYNYQSSPVLTNVTFADNYTGVGGGMLNTNRSSPVLTNVAFIRNTGYYYGGGIYNTANSSPTLANVSFIENTGGHGGGISNVNSHPSLTNVIFAGNSVHAGGGIYNERSSPMLTNVVISGNRANDGGGIYNNYDSMPILTNVTISGNKASRGGAMHSINSRPSVYNSIIWGNSDGVYHSLGGVTRIQYSIVQDGYAGNGNLNVDPRFVSPIAATAAPTRTGNLRLKPDSPAVDAGSNDLLPVGVRTDRDGKPRIQGGTVDMGAYERTPPLPTTATLVSSRYVSAVGRPITFTATLTATTGVPTGKVAFRDGTTLLGSATLVQGVATFTTSSLSKGTHTITASYGGNSKFAPSSDSLTQHVRYATTTVLSAAPNPAVAGTPIVLTAEVTSSDSIPNSTVTFRDGATVLGTVKLQAGRATLVVDALAPGTHNLSALYNGSSSFLKSTGRATLNVMSVR
jgi:hypothetical protein